MFGCNAVTRKYYEKLGFEKILCKVKELIYKSQRGDFYLQCLHIFFMILMLEPN